MTTSAEAPSFTPGALPAVTVPSFLNAGFSRPSASAVVSARIGSSRSTIDRRRPSAAESRSAGSRRVNRPASVAAAAFWWLRAAYASCASRADVVVLGDDLAGVAHVALLERAPQAVVDHRVDELAVAHAQAFAHARQQVRAVAHRLHAAGDRDVDVAGANALGGQHHGLEPRAAHLVDGQRGDVIGEPAARAPPAARGSVRARR